MIKKEDFFELMTRIGVLIIFSNPLIEFSQPFIIIHNLKKSIFIVRVQDLSLKNKKLNLFFIKPTLVCDTMVDNGVADNRIGFTN